MNRFLESVHKQTGLNDSSTNQTQSISPSG